MAAALLSEGRPTLDADGDGTIFQSEAVNQIKANFSMIDRNRGGGIDVDELARILKMAGSQ